MNKTFNFLALVATLVCSNFSYSLINAGQTDPIFSYVEFNEEGFFAPNGTLYCLTTLHQDELRMENYFDYLPCEMVKNVLMNYNYEKLPKVSYGYFKNLIPLSSNELKLKGAFFDSIYYEYQKVGGGKKFEPLFEGYIAPIKSALIKLEVPKLDLESRLTHWFIYMALNRAGTAKDSIDNILNRIVVDLNLKLRGKRKFQLKKVDSDKFESLPRCAANFYSLIKDKKELLFVVCSGSPYFFGHQLIK